MSKKPRKTKNRPLRRFHNPARFVYDEDTWEMIEPLPDEEPEPR